MSLFIPEGGCGGIASSKMGGKTELKMNHRTFFTATTSVITTTFTPS